MFILGNKPSTFNFWILDTFWSLIRMLLFSINNSSVRSGYFFRGGKSRVICDDPLRTNFRQEISQILVVCFRRARIAHTSEPHTYLRFLIHCMTRTLSFETAMNCWHLLVTLLRVTHIIRTHKCSKVLTPLLHICTQACTF